MKTRVSTAFLAALALVALPLAAQDRVDEEATRQIREYTTDPQFLTPLVDYLPASDSAPAPHQVLGYISGTPGKHTYYADILRYYRALDEASDRVTIFELGASGQGETMVVVAIGDEQVLADLDRYRSINAALADPRGLADEAARRHIAEGKVFYLVSGGLHSPETGSPEMLMEMAYRLAASETEMIRRIRANVVTLIIPVLEIDGWNRMVDWYYRHTAGIEKLEDRVRSSPPYWGNYTLHDNNRDGIMVSQPLTRNMFDAYFMFHPQVCLDLHESVALLYISTGTGPYYTAIDPILIDEWHWFSFNEVTQLTKWGVPGVWTHRFYTGWYPGYLLWLANNHNSIGRFYETFGNAGANTYERELSENRTAREWYRPKPPPEKLLWSLRNNTNIMQSGVLVSLDFAARNRDVVLENFWIKSSNAVEAGRSEKPCAWIIPTDQRDALAARRLIEVMRRQRVQMHELSADFTSGEQTWPAGSVVVRMDQPYRAVAKTLLEIQKWPEGNSVNPYDATGWTLGLMLGVRTDPVDDEAILEAQMTELDGEPQFGGRVEGMRQGSYMLVEPQGTAMMGALLELAAEGVDVAVADEQFSAGESTFPAGTWVLPGYRPTDEASKVASRICASHGLSVYTPSNFEPPRTRALRMPRLAFYHAWFNTQESGWTRFALDQAGVPYTLIDKDDVRAGGLGERFDVVLIPHHGGGSAQRFLRGVSRRGGPLAYTRTEQFRFHGSPDSSEDITGGLGFEGLLELERFVSGGGTLITLGAASSIVTDFGLLDGVSSASQSGVDCPGTLLSGTVLQPGNPVAYGYCEHPPLYRSYMQVFDVRDYMRKYVVAQFGSRLPEGEKELLGGDEEDAKPVPLLVSGLLRNGQALDGRVAILDAPAGEGRIVMFGFNPFYRWMNHSNFSFVFNAIVNWQAPAELRARAMEKEEPEEETN